MRPSWNEWTVRRLADRPRCRADAKNVCVPLRKDPLCRACYESDAEEAERKGRDEGV